jgi:excisionase family DNA binding protein
MPIKLKPSIARDPTGAIALNPLLSTRDVAKQLQLSPRTIRRYVKAGLLTPVRITARTVRFRAEQIQQLAG